jgi:hypothetical protein
MATLEELGQALQKAHAAGDTQGATILAREYQRQKDATPRDVTQDMSSGEKFLAGAGKAFMDVGRGIGNVVTDIAPSAAKYGFSTRADTDQVKKQDAALMNTGWGTGGNVVGNVAAALPAMFIPGGQTVAGGALTGGAMAALAPVGTDDSRTQNAAIGGATGAVVPAAMRAGGAVKAAVVDPFTDKGRQTIAARLLRSQTTNPDKVADTLAAARGATPGFNPTVGQAAGDDGIAALERTIRATYPQGFNDVEKSQRGAMVDALRRVAQTPEARSAAEQARESAVKPLYAEAKRAVVEGDDVIDSLLKRPSMHTAKGRAAKLASERGETFAMTSAKENEAAASALLDANGQPFMPATTSATPAQYGGVALHDLKMGLDDAIGNPGLGGMQGAERNAALGTKGEYLKWLEEKIPAYATAKQTYADMSRPLNQMDIGQELYNRFTPALADQGGIPFRSTAQAYANALRKGDDLAANVTGMQGAKLDKIMDPEQMGLLQGVAKDAATRAAFDGAGRGAGSDTVQKLAMSNIAAQAGVPNWIAKIGQVPGGMIKRVGDLAYGDADEQVRLQLAHLLQNPQEAAAAMKQAGIPPSKYAEYLKAMAQATALGANQTATGQN